MAAEADILRIVAGLNVGVGVTVQNVYHVQVAETGGVADADILDDMGEYLEDIYTEIQANLSDDLIYEEYSVTNVTADVDIGVSGWPTLNTGGDTTTQGLPAGLAGLVRGRTGTPGREGRKYLGPLTEGGQENGRWTTAVVNNLSDAGSAAYSPFTSTLGYDYLPGVYDRDATTFRLVDEVVATNIPAYQRRRRPGTGI